MGERWGCGIGYNLSVLSIGVEYSDSKVYNWTLDPSLYIHNPQQEVWINILTNKPYIDSTTDKPYSKEERKNYFVEELDLKYANYGVMCGYNGLIVVDVDIPQLDEYLHTVQAFQETFAVRTANSKLTHFYFYCEDNKVTHLCSQTTEQTYFFLSQMFLQNNQCGHLYLIKLCLLRSRMICPTCRQPFHLMILVL